MIDELKEIMDKKSYAEILFLDGESTVGFVTFVGKENFHVITMDVIPASMEGAQKHVDEEGNIHLHINPEDVEYIPVKQSFPIDGVASLTFDISHRVEKEMWKTLSYLRDNTIFVKKANPTTKKPRNRQKAPTNIT